MTETAIIKHCSPTLAGMKTGSMFTCPYQNKKDMCQTMRYWNSLLKEKGIRVIPLKYKDGTALIYFYRIAKLSEDLKEQTARQILEERGYEISVPERCISKLMKRLVECDEFPHEIGLFLGYPPEDVCGFIENGARNCKCVGCWKVYGDEQKARDTFARYEKCTNAYSKQLAKGVSIDRLAVAG